MLTPVYTAQFARDVKRLRKRKKDLEKLKMVIRALLRGDKLQALCRDHKLVGSFVGRHKCHMEGNWLLIYKVAEHAVIFERTGTHEDLFG